MTQEAMRLALEALERYTREEDIPWSQTEEAITALQEALANEALDKMAENARELGLDYEPAQQEPVAWEQFHEHMAGSFYTSPPKRKPLTDEEIEREWQFLHDEEGNPPDHHDFARAIEAAHGIREKNNVAQKTNS